MIPFTVCYVTSRSLPAPCVGTGSPDANSVDRATTSSRSVMTLVDLTTCAVTTGAAAKMSCGRFRIYPWSDMEWSWTRVEFQKRVQAGCEERNDTKAQCECQASRQGKWNCYASLRPASSLNISLSSRCTTCPVSVDYSEAMASHASCLAPSHG